VGRPKYWAGMLAGACIVLLAGFLMFGPGGRDDVYKTLWPARTFAESGRIINYNGEALEQSSSLLHVLALGAIHKVAGWNLPDLNFVFILCCGMGCLALGRVLAPRMGISDPLGWGIAMGGQAVFAYWAMGGLDGALAGLCWLLFACACGGYLEKGGRRQGIGVFLGACLVVLVRPEGILVGVGAVLALLLLRIAAGNADKVTVSRLLVVLCMMAAVAGALMAWRLWHSGSWMPQPVMAKAGGMGWERAWGGLRYVGRETLRHPELGFLWVGLLVAGVAMVKGRHANITLQLAWTIAVSGLAFVVLTGGDWMENGRFLVPFVPLACLILAARLEGLPRMAGKCLMIVWIGVSIAGLVLTARHNGTGYSPLLMRENPYWGAAAGRPFTERYNRVHLRDVQPFAALKAAVQEVQTREGRPAVVLSQQAGMMAYYLAAECPSQFRFMDLVGLCTKDFTDCPVTSGRGNFNGGLNMDLVYFFDDLAKLQSGCGIEKPDIVYGLDDPKGSLFMHVLGQGYRLAYLQDGLMPMGGTWFPGLEIEAVEFIVVREDSGNAETIEPQ
jgi:hypothetical protein